MYKFTTMPINKFQTNNTNQWQNVKPKNSLLNLLTISVQVIRGHNKI